MITKEGIKPHLEKVKAILRMQPSKIVRDVQRLNGSITAIGKFIPRCTDMCKQFFQLLKATKEVVEWTDTCNKAFHVLKATLTQRPKLQALEEGETLTVYVAASNTTVSAVLVKNKEGQSPVFYFSEALHGAEKRYDPLEKLTFTLVKATKRLKPYFQAHPVEIPTSFPLLQTLHKPSIVDRLRKWAIELSEFIIKFLPATTIEAQIVADILANQTPSSAETRTHEEWRIFVNDFNSKKRRMIWNHPHQSQRKQNRTHRTSSIQGHQ